jgi:hypothetical protein
MAYLTIKNKTIQDLKRMDFMRIARFVLGAFILYEGYQSREFLLMMMGGTFMVMALLNVGCFGSGNCAVTKQSNTKGMDEEVIFEEVK